LSPSTVLGTLRFSKGKKRGASNFDAPLFTSKWLPGQDSFDKLRVNSQRFSLEPEVRN